MTHVVKAYFYLLHFPLSHSLIFISFLSINFNVMEKPGPPPKGDQNLGHGIVAVIVVLLTISVIVVALRFATRIWIVRKLGWDDWTILFALV